MHQHHFSKLIDWQLLPNSSKMLIAVSGGADSVALLKVLFASEYHPFLITAHINHATRGAESDADENFVRSLSANINLPFFTRQLNMIDHSEAALREARYNALQEISAENNCRFIVTAHTASDVLESVLLNFLRNGSVHGWQGIAPRRKLSDDCVLLRPMLAATRNEVRQFLQDQQIEWREDSSNESTFYKRNDLRARLLPLLDELTINGVDQLARQTLRAAEVMRAETEFIDEITSQAWQKILIKESQDLFVIDGCLYVQLSTAIQRRLLRYAVYQFERKVIDLDFIRIEEVRNWIIDNNRRKIWQWRGGIEIEWTGENSGKRIRIKRTKANSNKEN